MARKAILALGVATGAAVLLTLAACSGDHAARKSAATNVAGHATTVAPQAAATAAAASAPVSAAADQKQSSAAPRAAPAAAAAVPVAGSAAGGAATPGTPAGPANALGSGAALDRKIVRNADLAIEVKDPEAVADSISSIAVGLGGYVAGSKLLRSDDVLRGTITLRVPAEQFDSAMSQVKALGTKVTRENITGQDVTEEYTDLDARIRNLEATADQLRALEATIREKTNRAEDILTVFNQLSGVTQQIEQAKGRQNALNQLSTLATLSVELVPPPSSAPPPRPAVKHAWSPARTLADAADALAGFGRGVAQVAIWTGVLLLPLGVAGGLLVYAAVLARRRWQSAVGSRQSGLGSSQSRP